MLIITLVGALLLGLVGLVSVHIVLHRLALFRFRLRSRNLPIVPGAHLLGNHAAIIFVGHRNCLALQRHHKKLGPTIGWLKGEQFCASTIDLDLIKRIVKDEANLHLDEMVPCLPAKEFEDSLLTARRAEWPALRQALAPALKPNKFTTPNVAREISESIESVVAFVGRQLERAGPDQLFNVDDLISRFSLTLIFKSFYKQDSVIDFDDPADKWTDMVEHSFNAINEPLLKYVILSFPILRDLFDWAAFHFTKFGTCRKIILEFVRKQTVLGMEARKQLFKLKREAHERGEVFNEDDFELEDGTKFRRNMIDHLIDQYLDKKLTQTQYINNTCFLLAAAHRTASDCMVHTMYLLSIDQARQERLRASTSEEGINSEYLEWVLKESLRLLPPAPVGCSRTLASDIKLSSGHVLPKDTYVVTNAYVIHRLKEFWGDDAEEFKPERWRDTRWHHPMQYIPFGAGLRNCPGRQFAMHAMKSLFVELLANFRFLGEPREDAYEFDSPLMLFVVPNSATRVRIERI